MSAAPLVSVLMTAYNRERYVGAAIESVLAQTFADFELIVVDDGSVDRTVEVARQYEDDPRLRIVLNERNLGDYPNRNRAAALARGRFLKYHDSDDVMYRIACRPWWARSTPSGVPALRLSGAAGWAGGPCPMLLTPRMCYQREFLGTQGLFMCGPASALFRADVFRALGGFPHLGVGSDYVFWLRACARVSVLLVSGDLFWYRVHPGQEIGKPAAAAEYAHAWRQAWPALLATDCPLTAEERELAKRNWTFIIARDALRALRSGQWSAARLRLAHAGLSWTDWLRYLRPPRRDRLAGSPMSRHEGGGVEPPPLATPARFRGVGRDERVVEGAGQGCRAAAREPTDRQTRRAAVRRRASRGFDARSSRAVSRRRAGADTRAQRTRAGDASRRPCWATRATFRRGRCGRRRPVTTRGRAC